MNNSQPKTILTRDGYLLLKSKFKFYKLWF